MFLYELYIYIYTMFLYVIYITHICIMFTYIYIYIYIYIYRQRGAASEPSRRRARGAAALRALECARATRRSRGAPCRLPRIPHRAGSSSAPICQPGTWRCVCTAARP